MSLKRPLAMTPYRYAKLTRENDALRLSIFILAVAIRSEVFTPKYAPISECLETRMEWLGETLKPLRPYSQVYPITLRMLNPNIWMSKFDEPRWMRQALLHKAEAEQMAKRFHRLEH